jgi:hypothetical protein
MGNTIRKDDGACPKKNSHERSHLSCEHESEATPPLWHDTATNITIKILYVKMEEVDVGEMEVRAKTGLGNERFATEI